MITPMLDLLIRGTKILAVGAVENGDVIDCVDISYPKDVIPGWEIHTVAGPNGFDPVAWDWIDGALSAKAPPAPPAPEVPSRVTMRQARLALLGAGLLGSVNSAIAAMTGPAGAAAQIEWEYSSEVQRHKVLVQALGPALGLTDAQLDALFVTAAAIA